MSMLSRASNCQKVSRLPRSPLSHLPQDLIFSGVLPKLPVKPLMRFQCVSKGWLSMISSLDFAKSHLDTHKNDEEDKLATFSATDDGLHLSLFPIVVEENQYPTNCSSLKVPEVALRYMGAHNGLLCFQGIDHKVVVCNPCTGKIKKINGSSWADNLDVWVRIQTNKNRRVAGKKPHTGLALGLLTQWRPPEWNAKLVKQHNEKVSVWQMREFGVEKSWTKLACVVELLPKSLHKTAMLTVAVICNSVSLVYAMNNRKSHHKSGGALEDLHT
nr:F-box/kelch-repeat protein At3g23880-like [Ipomoea batatas]